MNSPNAQIGNWLGCKPPATEADLLRIVEDLDPMEQLGYVVAQMFEEELDRALFALLEEEPKAAAAAA